MTYLYYAPHFDVFTDNNPITYVMRSAKLDAARQRWVAELADYDFQIHYKPGRLNTDADTLSRLPLAIESYMEDCTEETGRDEMITIVKVKSSKELCEDAWVNCTVAETTSSTENSEVGQDMDPGRTPIASLSSEDIRKAQVEDAELKRVHFWIEKGNRPSQKELKDETPLICLATRLGSPEEKQRWDSSSPL